MQASTAFRGRLAVAPRPSESFTSTYSLARPRSHAMVWLVVAMFAAMPLAWISLSQSALGVIRFAHLPALILMVMSLPLWAGLGRRIWGMVAAVSFYTVSYAAFSWFNAAPPFAIQQGFYIVAAFAVASIFRTATAAEWRVLRWCGPAAVASFLVFFWIDAHTAGVDPIAVYIQAVRSGQLATVEYLLFQPVFNARLPPSPDGNFAVLPNISHEIFSAVLIGIFVSIYARTIVRRNSRFFVTTYWVSLAIAAVLIGLSLSRSVQLVALLACLLPLTRSLLAKVHRQVTLYRAVVLVLLGAMVLASPVGGFALKRITSDTASYDARGSAISLAFEAIVKHPLTGSNRFAGVTRAELILHPEAVGAHNFVLEAAVIGGVITGLLALSVLVILAADSFRVFRRYLTDPRYLAPVVGGIMGMVWMFTSGRLNQPEWMGIALLYGASSAEPTWRQGESHE